MAATREILHTEDSEHIPLEAMGQKPWPNQIAENYFQKFDLENIRLFFIVF